MKLHKIKLPGTVHEIIPLEDGSIWALAMGGGMKLFGCGVSRDGAVKVNKISPGGETKPSSSGSGPWVVRSSPEQGLRPASRSSR